MKSVSFYIFLFLNYTGLLITYTKENPLMHHWLFFLWWSITFIYALLFSFIKAPIHFYQKLYAIIQKEWQILLAMTTFFLFTRFFLIDHYPYIGLGDELRDAGLNALKIKQGSIKDFFDFGNYQGYGNFIPLISYFFIPFFKISPLIYRIPSALFGVGALILTYILGYRAGGRKIGISASLLLTGSLLHLHYSRTELLVIADSFLSPLIIFAVLGAFYYQEGFFLTGLIMGLSIHFYAGIRGIIASSLLYLFGVYFIRLISSFSKKEKQKSIALIQTISKGIVLLIFGFIIGLGPTITRLKTTNVYTQVGTTTLIFHSDEFNKKKLTDKIIYIGNLYTQSFLSYTFKPTNDFHFVYYQKRQKESLLPFPLNWFFIIGLICIIIKKRIRRKLFQLLLSIIFIFPIFNEVVVNAIGFDHRLMSSMPILMVVASVGMMYILYPIKWKFLHTILMGGFLFIYLSSQLYLFFIQRVSDYGFDRKEYIFQEMLEYIKTDTFHSSYYIVYDEIYPFQLLHYQEKALFFTYPKNIALINKKQFMQKLAQKYERNETMIAFLFVTPFIESNKYPKKEVIKNCVQKKYIPDYACPLSFQGQLRFYLL